MCSGGRRRFVLGGVACVAATASRAQARTKRIGIVFNVFSVADVQGDKPVEPLMREFLAGLREHGWIEGENLIIERRSAEGHLDRLEAIVRALAAMPVDVIVVAGNAATLAAKRATSTVPVVTTGMVTPVESGIVASLARPGGNITGSVLEFGISLQQKRLELLRELLPAARHIVTLYTKETQGPAAETADAAKSLGLTLVPVDAQLPDIDAAFRLVERERPDALLVAPTVPLYGYYRRVVAFAARALLPDIYGIQEAVDAGGLASYGADAYEVWRRTARYVDRILRGAKPGDLPIEKSDRYHLAVNLRRARTLNIEIPRSVLQRAEVLS